ncbi:MULTISPECIES: hypothetical protein [unclassified Bradyrhizobium]|uniref:hypothetical protein n=1 Tax=unclassified Bradyrhizobium TaxID=2631580 RepID=UPI002478EC13|nr:MULTISPECIES: hypothetical protein [unclassified Bradyrhizobium]WGR73046.1 hypothetical protein MTX24_09500 [Bradyrhizobium sp. ISRA426]WGR77883.1 hypothetical protein MTX21_34465 [Bradyrhizobium sp. ISRA430]WGR88286.1 hypothetical protein MTX25_09505 [Bradyrhizobium sp. ISRA432]
MTSEDEQPKRSHASVFVLEKTCQVSSCRHARIDNPAPGCAKEFTAALLFNVDESHPPALDESGMFEAPQLFCKPVAAMSEAKVKTSAGLKP